MFHYSIGDILIADSFGIRTQLANNKYHVKIRFTQNRVRKYYTTGKILTKQEWEKLSDQPMPKYLKEARTNIQNPFNRAKSTLIDLINRGGLSFDALNSRLSKVLTNMVNTALIYAVMISIKPEQKARYHTTADVERLKLKPKECEVLKK
ncbi:MAG: hypothetical protein LBQ60_11635 [Bacteroidales bacterium]|jgi:uncharacterized membrane protein|nr:hypothetical protein [Bacteroidales bacterium]